VKTERITLDDLAKPMHHCLEQRIPRRESVRIDVAEDAVLWRTDDQIEGHPDRLTTDEIVPLDPGDGAIRLV
jgi:hypothetical protein